MKPVFGIAFGQSSADTKISVNGVDVSHAVRSVVVKCVAGELVKVEFECVPGSGRARLLGEVKHLDVDGSAVIRPEES